MSIELTSADNLVAAVLGPPSLRWRSERLDVASRKGQALLYYLSFSRRPVPRSELASLLWGEGRLDNLRQELSKLRHLPGAGTWLLAEDAVSIRVSSDAAEFELAVGSGRFQHALQAWRAEFLQGFNVPNAPAFREWVAAERERLGELHRKALKGQAAALEREGQHMEALDMLHRLLALDPLDESVHRSVMHLEYASGNVQAALEQFELCRRTLQEELGLAPLSRTSELARLIQRTDEAIRPSMHAPAIPTQLLRPPVLVGRDREWALLEQAWSERKGIFIVGPPGVGKTRLMLDFARSRGRYLLNEGHATDAAFPLSALGRGLRRIHRALPDLELEPWVRRTLARIAPDAFPEDNVPNGEDAGRPQLVEAWFSLINVLRKEVDALPADNVHWFDAASAHIFEAVSIKLARQERPSWRHLAAFRPDEMPEPVMRNIMRGADAGINAVIELRPLEEEAHAQMLTHLEVPMGGAFSSRLYGYTGGNPLFVVEVLRDLYARGKLELEVPRFELPTRITTIMRRRLDVLDPARLRLIRAIAVTHPDGTPELLASILDVDALSIAEGMGALEQDQWLRSGHFTHDLQYDAVMAHMPGTVASYLHLRAAEAHTTMGMESARIAYHLEASGAYERALPLWLEASRKHLSNELYREAIELLHKVVEYGGDRTVAQEARLEIARIRIAQGEPRRALHEIENVLRASLRPELRADALDIQAAARELTATISGPGSTDRTGLP